VDFEARIAALETLEPGLETDRAGTLGEALEHWTDGAIKLAITHLLLKLRADRPGLFASGDYEPLTLTGEAARHAVGFTRTDGEAKIAVICALQPGIARSDEGGAVNLPAGSWRDLFSGETVDGGQGVDLSAVFALLPVAVLIAG
jgi:(1->4)-alpha-D-glucan 1-alpha-D-glucosylmutase